MATRRLLFAVVTGVFLITFVYSLRKNHGDNSPQIQIYNPKSKAGPSNYKTIFPTADRLRKKIWQTSEHSDMNVPDAYRDNIRHWEEVNPAWRHEILTDEGAFEYVRDRFRSEPDIVEVFTSLKDAIMRADLIRYLVLLGDGGVYSDMDTEALKPIEDWLPGGGDGQGVAWARVRAAVGVEYDTYGQGRGQALLDLQLVNWTLLAREGHRLMELTVRNAVAALRALAKRQGVAVADVQASFNDVLRCTGPVQLTESTFQYLSEELGEPFTWRNVSGIQEPLFVHDIVIFPVTSFGNGQLHSFARPPSDPTALVHHQFKGTWKNKQHSYKNMKLDDKGKEVGS